MASAQLDLQVPVLVMVDYVARRMEMPSAPTTSVVVKVDFVDRLRSVVVLAC